MPAANFSTDWVDAGNLNTYYRMWLQHCHNIVDKAIFINKRVKEVRPRITIAAAAAAAVHA